MTPEQSATVIKIRDFLTGVYAPDGQLCHWARELSELNPEIEAARDKVADLAVTEWRMRRLRVYEIGQLRDINEHKSIVEQLEQACKDLDALQSPPDLKTQVRAWMNTHLGDGWKARKELEDILK